MKHRDLYNPFGGDYPDDNTDKIVFHQAESLKTADEDEDRHVLLCWTNGGPGNYAVHMPSVKQQSLDSELRNKFVALGSFTRQQRDMIVKLAREVRFEKTSRVNNCQTWMRDLLESMVEHGLLSKTLFDDIDQDVPLRKRLPEVLPVASV
ncbi:hypothetical protein B0H10DRAFT_2023868 [Mycena sp. CBHHK59/15]|nr:hypothetical protein B0H10DRAFT_2023868 [Mycena sp. CBHHK59/15]